MVLGPATDAREPAGGPEDDEGSLNPPSASGNRLGAEAVRAAAHFGHPTAESNLDAANNGYTQHSYNMARFIGLPITVTQKSSF